MHLLQHCLLAIFDQILDCQNRFYQQTNLLLIRCHSSLAFSILQLIYSFLARIFGTGVKKVAHSAFDPLRCRMRFY